jgi:hypothetical protein
MATDLLRFPLFLCRCYSHSQINAATSGARTVAELPKGKAKFQYYSLATPNGMKPAILLEELGIDYDAHSTLLIPLSHLFVRTSDILPLC